MFRKLRVNHRNFIEFRTEKSEIKKTVSTTNKITNKSNVLLYTYFLFTKNEKNIRKEIKEFPNNITVSRESNRNTKVKIRSAIWGKTKLLSAAKRESKSFFSVVFLSRAYHATKKLFLMGKLFPLLFHSIFCNGNTRKSLSLVLLLCVRLSLSFNSLRILWQWENWLIFWIQIFIYFVDKRVVDFHNFFFAFRVYNNCCYCWC